MKKIMILFVVVLFLSFMSGISYAEEVNLKKVDYFSIIIDQSGSMYMKSKCDSSMNKMELAKIAVKNMLENVPELSYNVHLSLASKDVNLMNEEYTKVMTLDKIDRIKTQGKIFGNTTNLYTSLYQEFQILSKSNYRKSAIILVTDGDWNRGENPLEIVKEIYNLNKNCVVYIISLVDTENGEKTLSDIAALNEYSLVADACELQNDFLASDFAKSIFYGTYEPIVINFDFDDDTIKSTEYNKIDELKNIDLLYDKSIVNGYTCTVGTEKYNQTLSENRAKNVYDAINANEFYGYGESETYSNLEKNRRAEIILR